MLRPWRSTRQTKTPARNSLQVQHRPGGRGSDPGGDRKHQPGTGRRRRSSRSWGPSTIPSARPSSPTRAAASPRGGSADFVRTNTLDIQASGSIATASDRIYTQLVQSVDLQRQRCRTLHLPHGSRGRQRLPRHHGRRPHRPQYHPRSVHHLRRLDHRRSDGGRQFAPRNQRARNRSPGDPRSHQRRGRQSARRQLPDQRQLCQLLPPATTATSTPCPTPAFTSTRA